MDFTEKRRHSLEKKQLNQALTLIVDLYTLEWLEKDDGHSIQILWKRRDFLATNELYALGCSIQKLLSSDELWVRNQVQSSKSSDKKNSQGALFEILALASMNHPDHTVEPAVSNQAGYDGILHFPEEKEIRISIKNYGISNPQERFEKKAKEIEAVIVNLLIKYDYPPLNIVIDASNHYPEDEDWDLLNRHIDEIFEKKRNVDDPLCYIKTGKEVIAEDKNRYPTWTVIIKPFGFGLDYHKDYKTYTLIISARFHNNESKNLIGKIESACFNLAKHSNIENDKLLNGLFVHLPIYASVEGCHSWLIDYFNDYPEKPISFVLLYQPSVAMNDKRISTVIHHHYKFFCRNERIAKWNSQGLNLHFKVPVGIVSQKPSKFQLIIEDPEGNMETLSLENSYIYQHGNHYVNMKQQQDGSFTGTMNKLAGGVYSHVILQFPEQSKSTVISEIIPPFDELLIL